MFVRLFVCFVIIIVILYCIVLFIDSKGLYCEALSIKPSPVVKYTGTKIMPATADEDRQLIIHLSDTLRYDTVD